MVLLNDQQCQRAKEIMQEYMSAPPGSDGKTPIEKNKIIDEERITIIEKELKPLLLGYIDGNIELSEFKFKVNSINKINQPLWPPIIAILPRMAVNDETLVEASKKSGISLERAFEKYIGVAFKILGYQTELLGQGKGRVPDGLALAHEESYAILWDAKVRRDGYSIGTDGVLNSVESHPMPYLMQSRSST